MCCRLARPRLCAFHVDLEFGWLTPAGWDALSCIFDTVGVRVREGGMGNGVSHTPLDVVFTCIRALKLISMVGELNFQFDFAFTLNLDFRSRMLNTVCICNFRNMNKILFYHDISLTFN